MNRLHLLKSLAPGFLPLLIFIAADAVWGTRIGLIVAVAFGLFEFAASYLKSRSIDRFILLDIGLITVLGLVSILLENDIFFKLKPALIEAIFCAIIAMSAFSPRNVLLMMTKRYMKDIELSDAAIERFKQSLKVMLILFLAHTLLVVYAALFMTRAAWAFVSGGLFYIIFGLYFLAEIWRNRRGSRRQKPLDDEEEWFDLVDPQGRITGRAPRSVCHSGPGKLHPVVHLHVIDARDRVYLQKRAAHKSIQPNKWDTAVGGHVRSGESIEDALKREANEELGLREFSARPVARYVWETEVESELVFMFVTRSDRAFTYNRDEIQEARYWKIRQIRSKLRSGCFSANFEYEMEIIAREVLRIQLD